MAGPEMRRWRYSSSSSGSGFAVAVDHELQQLCASLPMDRAETRRPVPVPLPVRVWSTLYSADYATSSADYGGDYRRWAQPEPTTGVQMDRLTSCEQYGGWEDSATLVQELDQQLRVRQWLSMGSSLPRENGERVSGALVRSHGQRDSFIDSNQPQLQNEMSHVLNNLEHVLQDIDLVCDELKVLVKDIDRVTGLVEAEIGTGTCSGSQVPTPLPLDNCSTHFRAILPAPGFPIHINSSSSSSSCGDQLSAMSGCGYESCFEKDLDFDDDELYEMSSQLDLDSPQDDDEKLDDFCVVDEEKYSYVDVDSINTWRAYTMAYVGDDDFIDDDVFISSDHLNTFNRDLEDAVNKNGFSETLPHTHSHKFADNSRAATGLHQKAAE